MDERLIRNECVFERRRSESWHAKRRSDGIVVDEREYTLKQRKQFSIAQSAIPLTYDVLR